LTLPLLTDSLQTVDNYQQAHMTKMKKIEFFTSQ